MNRNSERTDTLVNENNDAVCDDNDDDDSKEFDLSSPSDELSCIYNNNNYNQIYNNSNKHGQYMTTPPTSPPPPQQAATITSSQSSIKSESQKSPTLLSSSSTSSSKFHAFSYNNNINHSNKYNKNHIMRLAPHLRNIDTSTYDTLQRPFKYDKYRGRWSSAADFYFACINHCFCSLTFSDFVVHGWIFGGWYFWPFYLIAIIVYALPIFAIQTFIGQFSTSGTISAFRVAPLFKGVGYSILLLNMLSLSYYSIMAAVPLLYTFNSLHSTLPWMSCNNTWNSANCSTHSQYDIDDIEEYSHSTAEYFRHIIGNANESSSLYSISWPVLCGALLVWILCLVVLLQHVTLIGKYFRCTVILMLSLFIAIFAHLIIFVDFSWPDLKGYFTPLSVDIKTVLMASLKTASLLATTLLGPGWGSVITMASHNSFRRDSERLTFWVGATHVIIITCGLVCSRIALDNFEDHVGLFHYHVEEEHFMQFLYICFAYLFGNFVNVPNFWCFLFFGMIFMAEVNAVIIQMMTVLRAIFDEYERLRSHKTVITIAFVTLMMLTSVYFSTKQGLSHLDALPSISLLTHVVISLVTLLMITWIYGRARFQCDLQFMLGKTISNFKIFTMRIITPYFSVLCIIQILYYLNREKLNILNIVTQCSIYLIAILYMIAQLYRTNGTLHNRLKQCFNPHDWHPVDTDNRRFYEDVMGISEMLVVINAADDDQHNHNQQQHQQLQNHQFSSNEF